MPSQHMIAGAELALKAAGIKEGQQRTEMLNQFTQMQMMKEQMEIAEAMRKAQLDYERVQSTKAAVGQYKQTQNPQELVTNLMEANAGGRDMLDYAKMLMPEETTAKETPQQILERQMALETHKEELRRSRPQAPVAEKETPEQRLAREKDMAVFKENLIRERPVQSPPIVKPPRLPMETIQFELETGFGEAQRGTQEYTKAVDEWRKKKRSAVISSSERSKLGEIDALLVNIGKVRELYKYGTPEEHKEWVGPISGRVGSLKEKYTGTATPEQVKFYAYVRDMKDALLRARSGAQINEQEYKRLVGFLPDENTPPVTFKARLDRFEEQLQTVLSTKLQALQNPNPASGTKTVVKKYFSKSTGKTKYVYSDGTEEIK